MPVIGGRQSTVKANNTKKETPGVKVIKLSHHENDKPAEEVKAEENRVESNQPSVIKPIKRKPHINSIMFDQLSKSSNNPINEIKPESIQPAKMNDMTYNMTPMGNSIDFTTLTDMIVTRMDEEFVTKNELESLVKNIVEKVLQEMLVEPNKKDTVKPNVIKQNKSIMANSDISKPQTIVIGRKR